MSKFNLEFIKEQVSNSIFNRGLIMYKNNSIKIINKKINNIAKNQSLIIECKVLSSQSQEEYEVNLYFDFYDGDIIFTNKYCDCMYFQINNATCKHIIASLIYCYHKSSNQFLIWSGLENEHKNLISFFQNQEKQNENPMIPIVKCNIRITIENMSLAKLQLKVGINQLFEVKNIFEFIKLITDTNPTIFEQKTFLKKYGFSLNKQEQKLSINLQKIVNFLYDEFEIFNMKLPNGNIINFYNFEDNNSKFRLLSVQLERLLKKIKGETIDLIYLGTIYNDILITEENYESKLNINLVNNQIIISNQKEKPLFLTSKLQSILENKKVLFLANNQKNNCKILQTMNSQNQISFDENDKQDVIQYIISPLLKRNNNIVIDPIITNNIINTKLIIESYFDFDGEYVILKSVFKYDDIIFDINDNSSNPNKIVLRDYIKEKNYLYLFSTLPFEKNGDKLVLNDLESIIKLVSNLLPVIEQQSIIYYTENFQNVRLIKTKINNSNISINENQQLLEFNFSLENIAQDELKSIFISIKNEKKYHRFENGNIVDLKNKTLINFVKLSDKFDIPLENFATGKFLIPKYHAPFLNEELSNFKDVSLNKSLYFTELITKITNFNDNDITVSSSLNAVLRDYQIKGHKWLKTLALFGFGGILADEMGLGKTLQTISYIVKEYELNSHMEPILIIAPASIIYNWKNEFKKFAPQLKKIIVDGTKQIRKEILKNYKNYQILITSYPLLRRDFIEYDSLSFSHCFIDEAQHIKNPASLNAKVTKGINSTIKFALTGTPIENNLTELWSIFDFVLPGLLLSHHKFQKQYEIPITRKQDKVLLKQLIKKTKPFILRRLKNEVITELPNKIENKVIIEMTSRQKKIYAAYAMAARKELEDSINNKNFYKNKIQFLTALMRLRQICCDPSIIDNNYEQESAKLNILHDILEELISFKHKILIFSQFTKILKKIIPILKKLKINYLYLDGKTDSKSRVLLVEEFNNNSNISVFLISLKAGGVGLNLTSADVVIHFDPWWNPSIENQATDRAHRIGQKKVVQVIKLITKGTIEEKIITIQNQKLDIINSVFDGNNDTQLITNLTETELMNLLTPI
ncbi:DEAD/DEAH box helicase [Spiroplasma endosymbiont of Nomada ruficornis]|uniref:DEAD/DEAH box helicase n=1 Tax=Spiroplasma endosymbiont of Nomada ruficornis TaxID=3066325 RepID=UPI00313D3DCA